ncbi:Uncharacterised protein [Mycobacterium tuberculosis]|nr:Uncharacterised protein [Mycobacterium tuberculosis]
MREFLREPLATIPQPDLCKQRVGPFDKARKFGPWPPDIVTRNKCLKPDANVLTRRQLREYVGNLEGLCDAHMCEFVLRNIGDVASFELDLAGGRRKSA